jgi:hypothetical protein
MNCLRNIYNAPRAFVAQAAGLASGISAIWCGRCIYLFQVASELGSDCRALFYRGLYSNIADMIRFQSQCPEMNEHYLNAAKAGGVAVAAAGIWYMMSRNNQAPQPKKDN